MYYIKVDYKKRRAMRIVLFMIFIIIVDIKGIIRKSYVLNVKSGRSLSCSWAHFYRQSDGVVIPQQLRLR